MTYTACIKLQQHKIPMTTNHVTYPEFLNECCFPNTETSASADFRGILPGKVPWNGRRVAGTTGWGVVEGVNSWLLVCCDVTSQLIAEQLWREISWRRVPPSPTSKHNLTHIRLLTRLADYKLLVIVVKLCLEQVTCFIYQLIRTVASEDTRVQK